MPPLKSQENQYFVSNNAYPPSIAHLIQGLNKKSQALFTLRKKIILTKQNSPFKGLYIPLSGILKQTHQLKAGDELLTHFFLPGDIIGLDAMGEESYFGTVTAIETSCLLHIPFIHIEDLSISRTIHIQLLNCLSRAIHNEHKKAWQMNNHPPDIRLASFLINISLHFRNRGFSPHCFRLGMSRNEIAQYLGMASETLSRLISRFKQEGVLSVISHVFCILNTESLAAIAEQRRRR
ncbi:helix-turn-helix domain-containing protein [Vreelandella titanicae]|uniref:helix-turn-helix domain-containing protein n=1 Tax=Vreelandella titanicae TaxID=664683 RepID=UPI003811AE56